MDSVLVPYTLGKMSILALALKSLVQQPLKIFPKQIKDLETDISACCTEKQEP